MTFLVFAFRHLLPFRMGKEMADDTHEEKLGSHEVFALRSLFCCPQMVSETLKWKPWGRSASILVPEVLAP